jgi:hypothetical protein
VAIAYSINAYAANSTANGALVTQLVIDGAANGMQARNDAAGTTSSSSVSINGTRLLAAGHHTISQTISTTGTPSSPVQETYVLFRG